MRFLYLTVLAFVLASCWAWLIAAVREATASIAPNYDGERVQTNVSDTESRELTPLEHLLVPQKMQSKLSTGAVPEKTRWHNSKTLLHKENYARYKALKEGTGIGILPLGPQVDELRREAAYANLPRDVVIEMVLGRTYFNQLTPEQLEEATNKKAVTLTTLRKAGINFSKGFKHWTKQLELLEINPDRVFSKMCWLKQQLGKKVEGMVAARMALGSELLKEKPTSHLGESSKTL
ncbi:hypothetical protein PsorP6_018997 [Peronosclerospora sorghi]|nr:hypothetical protein PsorP6_018997 [Peronosclerospora sorghi]